MLDFKYIFSHQLPVRNLLVQAKNDLQLLFVKKALNFTAVFYLEFRYF